MDQWYDFHEFGCHLGNVGLNSAGVFEAREVLAKHDETYMPPEVAEALKAAGQWQGQGGQGEDDQDQDDQDQDDQDQDDQGQASEGSTQ